jgi:hypothetical protein
MLDLVLLDSQNKHTFDTYEDAAIACDEFIAQHIANLTEKISPWVVEENRNI